MRKPIMDEENKANVNKYIILIVIFTILIVIFTALLRIPFVYESAESYNLVFYFGFASILLFSVGIMYRPWEALFICVLGSVLGEWCYCLLYGAGYDTPVFLLFSIVSPGLMGAVISVVLRKLKPKLIYEIIAMIIGGIWQYIGLMIAGFIWYAGFLTWKVYIVFIWFPVLLTAFDLFLIPVSVLLNKVLRSVFKVRYFDDLLNI